MANRVDLYKLLHKQLNHFFEFTPNSHFEECFQIALHRAEECLNLTSGKYWTGKIDPYHTVQYSIFLYYLSNTLGKNPLNQEYANQVYYLNKIMNCVDWFWAIDLPCHFFAEHPVASVLGRANYGDFLFFMQGCTIGTNRKNGVIQRPTLGNYVVCYTNSTIIGNCNIGNHVIISAGSYIKEETIPDQSIVFGSSPALVVKPFAKERCQEILQLIWREP